MRPTNVTWEGAKPEGSQRSRYIDLKGQPGLPLDILSRLPGQWSSMEPAGDWETGHTGVVAGW